MILHKSSAHLMRKRTQSREFALQILYQMDITREDAQMSLANFWDSHKEEEIRDDVRDFTVKLVCGVGENLKVIDDKISEFAANWKLERMAVVDRNILRMGCFELLFRDDIPPKVSINEAVDLAKKYSCAEAGKFVNAILDKIKLDKNK